MHTFNNTACKRRTLIGTRIYLDSRDCRPIQKVSPFAKSSIHQSIVTIEKRHRTVDLYLASRCMRSPRNSRHESRPTQVWYHKAYRLLVFHTQGHQWTGSTPARPKEVGNRPITQLPLHLAERDLLCVEHSVDEAERLGRVESMSADRRLHA
jgi:hypothetical protein